MPAPTSSSKRSQGPAARGVDRLSSLPEPLLHLMMSFLTMHEVVRTSLLSPSWRYLWASVPFIHLDYKDFVGTNYFVGNDPEKEMALKKFGDHLLLLRDRAGLPPLEEARIFIRFGDFRDKCISWIHHAIRQKARMLHVYGHPMLEAIGHSSMVPSQHLKKIRLERVNLLNTWLTLLNSDFPALEHVELEYCNVWFQNMISVKSLKTIGLSRCQLYGCLEICALNLKHLSILDPSSCNYRGFAIVTRDLHSLVTASISLRSGVLHGSRDKIWNHGILDGLSHVTALELHAPLSEPALERSLQTCPVFGNLTRLVLGEWCMASEFSPLLFILRRSPKLKDLTFKLKMEKRGTCKDAEYSSIENVLPREESPSSYPSIERVVIYCRARDDPRVSALVQVLQPLVIPGREIGIKGY